MTQGAQGKLPNIVVYNKNILNSILVHSDSFEMGMSLSTLGFKHEGE